MIAENKDGLFGRIVVQGKKPLKQEGKTMANNAKTITVELTEEEASLVKSGLMFIADTTNLDRKCYMCWNIIDKMDTWKWKE